MNLMSTLSPGRVAYQLYYRPKAIWKSASRRGLINTLVDNSHHRQMMRAARTLLCLDQAGRETLEVHFLTGRRFWHQTAFCAWSLSRFGQVNIAPVLHDDGTLTEDIVQPLRNTFPALKIKSHSVAERLLDQHLPRSRFPQLRARRDVYPNLKKLMDVHVGEQGWQLVLDSDMLFFREPVQLLNWLRSPDRPCHMVDSETSYGYPLDFLSRQCGHAVEERVNVGITGLRSESIPWTDLEHWTTGQNETFGPHYYQEQALIAQLVAGESPEVVDAQDYKVLPTETEVASPTAVMHHYVADSKPWYYRYGWRHVLRLSSHARSASTAKTGQEAS